VRLPTTLLLIAAAPWVLGCADPTPDPARNLLLVTLDTLRADHLGLYGYERPTSPALDAFAEGATVFEDVTCSMPTTLPSHLTILTGLRPFEHGVRRNGTPPTRDLVTIFDLLGERGAKTAAIVAARVLEAKYLVDTGIERVILGGRKDRFQYPARSVTDRAVRWLEEHHAEPFALWVHYFDAHEPYSPPPAWFLSFDRGYDGPLPDRLSVDRLLSFNDPVEGAKLSAEDREHIVDLYDAEVAYLDRQLGRLLRRLTDLGRLEDTLVLIVGDHGQALGENDFFGHGARFLEPVVRVPLLLRRPGQSEGARVSQPIETVDLMPTVAELMAFDPPVGLSGRSLVPLLTGGEVPVRRYRLIERRVREDLPQHRGVALHGGDWKAIYYRDRDGTERYLLGRAESGLDREEPLAPHSEEAALLDRARALVDAPPAEGEAPGAEDREMLEALGYLG
jgi:arylsulfatase A-like enzyme